MDSAVDLTRLGDQAHVRAQYRWQRQSYAAGQGFGIADISPYADEGARLSESLAQYIREAWHVLEPTTKFIPGWHLDAIAEHLEAVTVGDILDLVINMPPRCMKSLSVVMWNTWAWTKWPGLRWLCSSYANQLSVRDSVKCRRLIQSPWYQSRWGHVYQLTTDQNVKQRFENDRLGYRVATSVGGFGTGEGGDIIVFDDPHNVLEGESELKREGAVTYWRESMSTRRNHPKAGRVVIQQRVHELDVTGSILAEEDHGYEILMLPMRFDPERRCVTVIWEDPRTEDRELLWPDRFSDEAVRKLEKDLGPYGTAGQLQQTPTARTGGQFERSWFEIVEHVPKGSVMIARVRYWDKAGSQDDGAYTVGTLMSLRNDGLCYVEDVVRGQWAAGDRERIIRETAEEDAMRFAALQAGVLQANRFAVLQVVEQEPGSGGKDSAKATVRNLAGFRVEAETASGDKFIRADPLAGAAKNGDIKLVKGYWNADWLREMEAAGPGAALLDQMDSAAGAYNRLQLMAEGGLHLPGLVIEEMRQVSPHAIS